MTTPLANRLKQARQMAGYESPTDAARAFGWVVPTYLGHENGSRGFKLNTVARYARAFQVSEPWLATGKGRPKGGVSVNLVGSVGAGAQVLPFDDYAKGGGAQTLDLPQPDDPTMVAVRVEGESMLPAYKPGDAIVYRKEGIDDPSRYLLRECVVQLTDGRLFVKTLRRGDRKGLFTLASHNASDIENVKIEWAAPVLWVKRAS